MNAIFSPCERYRYVLRREIPQPVRWNRPCLFVMLNPSTADATNDDPTIRRCIGFAAREGCTSLTVVNLFALRSTNPDGLIGVHPPVGPMNDQHIREEVVKASTGWVIAAWGAHRYARERARKVFPFLGDVWCLGTTKDGYPRHPLYVRSDQSFVRLEGV